jgi:hypothetical protein
MSFFPDSCGVVVAVKLGLLEQHGKVRTAEGIFEVRRGDDGWYSVAGPNPEASGRVRYDAEQELLEIDHEGTDLSIHFRPELERTTFELDGRVYDVASMHSGEISIKGGTRLVVRGHATVSGVRLTTVDVDLQPLERELAVGLALRSTALEEEFWKEDHPRLPY